MTYQEALNYLDNVQVDMKSIESMCEASDLIETCKKAIEKQIPKKPELWHNQPYPPEWADDDWGYKCPTCGNEDIDYPEHHCSCGQALDWSDIE